jgi:hypothetical protein
VLSFSSQVDKPILPAMTDALSSRMGKSALQEHGALLIDRDL